MLSPPETPHYISCTPDVLYKRANVFFHPEFVSGDALSYTQLATAFKKGGIVLEVSQAEIEYLYSLLQEIKKETDVYRKKLILLYMISKINDLEANIYKPLPEYVMSAMNYVNENYAQKITAYSLAKHLKVGRTTLLTSFKNHCGITLNSYILSLRLKKVIMMLQNGASEYDASVNCGFNETSNLIRVFKRQFNTTPSKYVKLLKEKSE